jgi:hypothetical protein
MPADLIAVNSELSPKFPNVMIAANKIPSGNAMGTRVVDNNPMNLLMVMTSRPLPINSSIHTHMNCMIKMSHVTKKAAIKGGINDLIMNEWRAFNEKYLRKSNGLR